MPLTSTKRSGKSNLRPPACELAGWGVRRRETMIANIGEALEIVWLRRHLGERGARSSISEHCRQIDQFGLF
jgi:hypothetical protein